MKSNSNEVLPNKKVTSGNEATDLKVEQALLDLNDLKSEAISSMAKGLPGTGNGAMASTQMTAFGGPPSATNRIGNQSVYKNPNSDGKRPGAFGLLTINSSNGFQQ